MWLVVTGLGQLSTGMFITVLSNCGIYGMFTKFQNFIIPWPFWDSTRMYGCTYEQTSLGCPFYVHYMRILTSGMLSIVE